MNFLSEQGSASAGPSPFSAEFYSLSAGCDRPLGTDEYAEMAADTFFAVEPGPAVLSKGDRLVAAVRAGDHASAAADAFVPVEFGINHCIALEHVSGITDVFQSLTAHFIDTAGTYFRQVEVQP